MTSLLSCGREPGDVDSMTYQDIVDIGTRLRLQAGLKPYQVEDETPEENYLKNRRSQIRTQRSEDAKRRAREREQQKKKVKKCQRSAKT